MYDEDTCLFFIKRRHNSSKLGSNSNESGANLSDSSSNMHGTGTSLAETSTHVNINFLLMSKTSRDIDDTSYAINESSHTSTVHNDEMFGSFSFLTETNLSSIVSFLEMDTALLDLIEFEEDQSDSTLLLEENTNIFKY